MIFSLTPCTAKESAFNLIGSDYEKPLHPTKTTAQSNTCVSSVELNEDITSISNIVVDSSQLVANFDVKFDSFETIQNDSLYTATVSISLPPKYILFKRLKISAA